MGPNFPQYTVLVSPFYFFCVVVGVLLLFARKKHLADPDLEVFDKTPDEDKSDLPKHETVEKETGSQTPATLSAAPEATATAAHDEL